MSNQPPQPRPRKTNFWHVIGETPFSRLCATAALLAFASPATAEKKAAKGCELLPQYDALVSAYTKFNNSFTERIKLLNAQEAISRDDVIVWNTYRDADAALGTLLIEILNGLGPNCLPKEINRDKMIADARASQERAQTRRLPVPPPGSALPRRVPVPPPKPGDGSALPSDVAPSTKSTDRVSPPVGVA